MSSNNDDLIDKLNNWKGNILEAEKYLKLVKLQDSPGNIFNKMIEIESNLEKEIKSEHNKNIDILIGAVESYKKSGDTFIDEFIDPDGYNNIASIQNKALLSIEEYRRELEVFIENKKQIINDYEKIYNKLLSFLKYKKQSIQ